MSDLNENVIITLNRRSRMKQLEKEITESNKQDMRKRYQMYGAAVSRLTGKIQNNNGKGERA